MFESVLNERVKVLTVDKTTDEQGVIRDGRGCVHQIFVVRQRSFIEKDEKMQMTYVVLEKVNSNMSSWKFVGGVLEAVLGVLWCNGAV